MDPEKFNELYKNLSDSRKALLTSKEKITEIKKEVVKVVESLLEKDITSADLISACQMLSQPDYSDVVEERNILNLCGYPLCSKPLKKMQQKYHISIYSKKVYDVTERKCFCSNKCYKASKFVKLQLCEVPVWFNENPPNVNILNDDSNSGSPGEEVVFKEEFQEQIHEPKPVLDYSVEQLLLDDISECAAQFKDLLVRETQNNITDEVADDNDDDNGFTNRTDLPIRRKESDDHVDSDDSNEKVDTKFFPDVDNKSLPLHKTMPALTKTTNRLILIDPLPLKIITPEKVKKREVTFIQMKKVLQQWMTQKSVDFIFGNTSEQSKNRTASNFDESFEKLCRNVDALEASEEALDEKFRIEQQVKDKYPVSSIHKDNEGETKVEEQTNCESVIQKESNTEMPKKNRKFKKGSKSKKSVRFSDLKEADSNEDEDIIPDPVIPLVDSLSQNALRLQVVTERLKVAYSHLLPLIGFYFRDISKSLKELLLTFKFDANNVINSPFEWKMLAVILLRMLKKKFTYCSDTLFVQLLKKSTLSEVGSIIVIDKLIESFKSE